MTKLAEQRSRVAISTFLIALNLAQHAVEQVQALVDFFEQPSHARQSCAEQLDAGPGSGQLLAQSELNLQAVQALDSELANQLGLPLVVAFRLENARQLLRLED